MQVSQNKINNSKQQLNKEKLNKGLEDEIKRLKDELQNKTNEINTLRNNIQNLKNEIQNLKDENKNLKERLNNTNSNHLNQTNINEINDLRQIIIQKDKEITELKSQLPKINVNMRDIMVINFLSTDQFIRCGIPCLPDDTFAEVEEKLYQQFDEFRSTNNILLFGGNVILRFKKVRENNIRNGDIVQVVKPE